jgi:hypothetical protein
LELFLLFVPRLSEIEAAEINIFDSSADASSIKICELLISLFLKFSNFFCISGDFNVNNFVPTISDCHCIIEWSMSAKFTIDIIADEVKLYDKSSNFIWSDDSIAEFQAALLSPDIQKKLENFKNKDINNSQILIDDASAELSNIFISAASISLKRFSKGLEMGQPLGWCYSRTIILFLCFF